MGYAFIIWYWSLAFALNSNFSLGNIRFGLSLLLFCVCFYSLRFLDFLLNNMEDSLYPTTAFCNPLCEFFVQVLYIGYKQTDTLYIGVGRVPLQLKFVSKIKMHLILNFYSLMKQQTNNLQMQI